MQRSNDPKKRKNSKVHDDRVRFAKRYRHIGVSFPSVPEGWIPIVKNAVELIEKRMWPQWIPLPLRQLIHWLATGNSVVKIKYYWAYRLRQYLTRGQMISCIKDKFAGLRIYGTYGSEIEAIITAAEIECSETCEFCGSTPSRITGQGWLYNACSRCEAERQLSRR